MNATQTVATIAIGSLPHTEADDVCARWMAVGRERAAAAARVASLAAYIEASQTGLDDADAGASIYAWLAAHESSVRASEIDLGLDF